MRKLFINQYGQLRSGWKIGLVLCITIVLTLLLSISINLSVHMLKIRPGAVLKLISRLILPICMIAATYFSLRVIDRKSLSHIGMTGFTSSYKELIYGLLLGAASITVIFIVLLGSGNIALTAPLTKPEFSISPATEFILFVFVGFGEEFFGRGYCMTALHQTGKPWVSVFGSALIFSLLHGMNPNVTPLALMNIFFVGLLFAVMFLQTGSLWMPIGYHITWNYFQGVVFGFPVSGTASGGIYHVKDVQNNLLTGGAFGPEGGLLCTAVILLSFALLMKYPDKPFSYHDIHYR